MRGRHQPSVDHHMAEILPDELYRVLHLRVAQRLSVEVTAEQLAVDPMDVLLLQHEALQMLRHQLTPPDPELR